MKRVTIKDVAKEAGVSISTVSRVINSSITDKAMETRVLNAINKLNYQPNRRAQGLRTNKVRIVGLLISDIENPFFTSLVRGVEDVAQKNQMNIILCNSDENLTKQTRYIRALTQEMVAGLIIAPTAGTSIEGIRDTLTPNIPYTLLDRDIGKGESDVITVDNEYGAYSAVKHLYERGYSKIALINGDEGIYSFEKRLQGYRLAHSNLKIPFDENLISHVVPRINPSYQATHKLLQDHPEIDAIFAANNLITLGSLKALRELGLRVPTDIGIVGFDDMPWSSELYVPITCVQQPTYEIGKKAMEVLLERIANPDADPVSVEMQTKLIIRESTLKH